MWGCICEPPLGKTSQHVARVQNLEKNGLDFYFLLEILQAFDPHQLLS